MKTIEVQTGVPYTVTVESGLLAKIGVYTRAVTRANTVVLVSDDTVSALYGAQARASLEAAGFTVHSFVFPHGEASKTLETYGALLTFAAERRLTRTDCFVALGGGVVGDLTGFAAATYQRGVDFVQVPTTLLAAVDASVGGKTAVDLPQGKNLAGAFYQPRAVLCDPEVFATLPPETFADGMAEVIKYGMVFDRAFLSLLETADLADTEMLEAVLAKCIRLKRDVVAQDERDHGLRGLLNFGHTIGHAVEACSAFSVTHGQAVAVGMVRICRGAYRCGLCATDCSGLLIRLLQRYHLPTETAIDAQTLYRAALADKKRDGAEITLVLPETAGHCVLKKTAFSVLQAVLEQGEAVCAP